MNNPIILTQCFCNADILQFSMKNLYEYLELDLEHWILLKHYPIHKEENTRKILEYAKQYGCKVHDCGGDIGATEGLNHFFDTHPELIKNGYIGFDPDTMTSTKGFDKALIEVAREEKSLCIVGLSNAAMHPACAFTAHVRVAKKFEMLMQKMKVIAGHKVIMHDAIDMVNCCYIDSDWVMSLPKRFWEYFKYYGGIESYLWDNMSRCGKKLGYMVDYKETYDGNLENYKHDEYKQWKHDHLCGFKGSLEEWLISKGKKGLML